MPSHDIITQMLQHIKGICSTVRELVEQVKVLASTTPPQTLLTPMISVTQPSNNQQPQQPAADYRTIVHEELKEMKERDKRKESVIIKGLSASSSIELTAKFEQLSDQVMGAKVILSDVSPISGHPNLYRAKIKDANLRKLVLEKAKMLRSSDFSSVYISRDLTYAQRTELFARRKAKQTEAQNAQKVPVRNSGGGNLPQAHSTESAPQPTPQGN